MTEKPWGVLTPYHQSEVLLDCGCRLAWDGEGGVLLFHCTLRTRLLMYARRFWYHFTYGPERPVATGG